MVGKVCKMSEDTFYVVPGFEKAAEEYFYSNFNDEDPLVITNGTFEIPSSAIQVAHGLWKQRG